MTSIAARAHAAKIAAAQEAAAAAQAAVVAKPRKPVRKGVVADPAPPTPAITRRLSPAARRKSYLVAATAGGVLAAAGVLLAPHGSNDDGAPGRELEGVAAKVLLQLQEDRRRLKAIASVERKIEAKRGLLPTYEGWIAGVLASGRGERIELLDDLFTTIMAWRIDVGDYLEALAMAEYALRHSLPMPERFSRSTAAFVVEQIAEAAIRAYDAGDAAAEAFPAAILPMLQDLIDTYDCDIHDEIAAKLQRTLGLALMSGADVEDEEDLRARREQTVRCYLRALELNPRVGVKKQVEQLQRHLKPGTTSNPASETESPPVETESSPTETGAAAETSPPEAADGQNTPPPQGNG